MSHPFLRTVHSSSFRRYVLLPLALGLGLGAPLPVERLPQEEFDFGTVVDCEGSAFRREELAERWSEVRSGQQLAKGDWLKTATRGANALVVALARDSSVETAVITLGPGTLIELVDEARIQLLRGEIEVSPAPEQTFEVESGDAERTLQARTFLRAQGGELIVLPEEPAWLTGYRQKAPTDALGALLANVDGRNVPLSIGYHKVVVDIRDQIARTVVEESFVNHTDSILEGVFYFPLPSDASISGFGMWIGDELVQGEIVEKQRARAIYETILRERRDPGLLEWAGGSIFKARVFPIGAEKRIRIAYTQVLAKRADQLTYRYALRSELLRLNPLERLELVVNLHSTQPIASVESPTHGCRIRSTEHGAQVEFEAEEYVPERDFELEVDLEPRREAITLIPHRRGNEGYFMLLLDAPPAEEDPATAKGPLDLLVLADTSGSTNGPPRQAQIAFVETMLGALSEQDSFNLATCDTETLWVFDGPQANTEEARERALDHLEARAPLGWTDLDLAFSEALARVREGTHVVYLGDGVITAGDADPAAFAARLSRLDRGIGTFHAVVPGTQSEPIVVNAIGAIGGGSVRAIPEGGAAAAAFELLEEITVPSLKGLEVRFTGVGVAAVHPERLPNLPSGRQQIVVGRYDPLSTALEGQVLLSGTLGGKRVVEEMDVSFAGVTEEEAANSYLPRLWARRQLDHLLSQGSFQDATLRDRVIALSEDFQIITPYTSFLVLESDADRERFAVQRAFRMRDGEEFFAQGRELATHELLVQSMNSARRWRAQLVARARAELAEMGRGLTESLRIAHPEPYWLGGRAGALGYAVGAKEGSELFFDGRQDQRRSVEVDALESQEGPEQEDADQALNEEIVEEMPISAPAEPEVTQQKVASAREEVSSAIRLGYAQAQGANFSLAEDRITFPRPGGPFRALFPYLSDAPEPSGPERSGEVFDLLRRLDRRALIAGIDGGLRFRIAHTLADARGRGQERLSEHWLASQEWLSRSAHGSCEDTTLQWLFERKRGALNAVWLLGQTRPEEERDRNAYDAPFAWYFGDLLGYGDWSASQKRREDGLIELTFTAPYAPEQAMVFLIDDARALILEQNWLERGEKRSSLVFDGFFELSGAWWPASATARNEGGEIQARTGISIEHLDPERWRQELAGALKIAEQGIVIGPPTEDLAAAKQAVASGRASLEEELHLLDYFASRQRFDQAEPRYRAFVERCGNKLGVFAIRATWLSSSRRNEELKSHLMLGAEQLAREPSENEYARAHGILGYAQHLNEGNEMLALVKKLRPVFARCEVEGAMLPYDRAFLDALRSLARPEEVLAKLREMAVAHPTEASVQAELAGELAQRGGVDEALRWLERVEAENGPWQEHEVDLLRRQRISILWQSHRLGDLVDLFHGWEEEERAVVDASLWSQYLSALVFLDREGEASARIETWLTEYRSAQLAPVELARLSAAVEHALGRGYELHSYRFEQERAALLAQTARALLEHSPTQPLAGAILLDYRFRQTDEARALLGELFERIERELEELEPAKLQLLVSWLRGGGFEPPALQREHGPNAWKAIFERVLARWSSTEMGPDREVLAGILLSSGERDVILAYRRRLLAAAEEASQRVEAARGLFYALMAEDWSQEREDELFALWPLLGDFEAQGPLRELALRWAIVALYDLTGWLPEARANDAIARLPEITSMSRQMLALAREQALQEARESVAETLGAMLEQAGNASEQSSWPGELRPWVEIERSFLLAKLGRDLEAVERAAQERLSELVNQYEEDSMARVSVERRDAVLAERCVRTASHLLVRGTLSEPEEDLASLRALLEAAVARATSAEESQADDLIDWQGALYRLLVALDRSAELEALLADWYGGGGDMADLRFGRALAYLMAERSALPQAVELFGRIAARDELSHEDYRALSDWLTALDRREEAVEARMRSYQVLGEAELAQSLQLELGKYQRVGDALPSELDPEIPIRFRALFGKAQQPAHYLWLLASYYAPTQDFRLLEGLAPAVIGHSSQAIYPFLENLGAVTDLIHEEATLDRLVAQIDTVRRDAVRSVDWRALNLLEFCVERRASGQSQGAVPHAERALTALRRVFNKSFEEGEPRLLAQFLAQQGPLSPEALAAEQLRQLGALREVATHDDDRFAIDFLYAQALWSYGRSDEAVRELESALAVLRSVRENRLPETADVGLTSLDAWLRELGEYKRAEEWWLSELGLGHPPRREQWLTLSLFQLRCAALHAGAEVSIGRGMELYERLLGDFREELLRRSDEQHSASLMSAFCELLLRSFRELGFERARQDAIDFAFGDLPEVLSLYQHRDSQGPVGEVADCLRELAGPSTSLEFLIVRAETEPRWLRLRNQDFWAAHAWRLARDLQDARRGEMGESLEQRALAIILRELEADLGSQVARDRSIYSERTSLFWAEKREEFRRVAVEFAAERARLAHSHAALLHAASYLFHDLSAREDAIAALLEARRSGLLEVQGLAVLAEFLQQANRWKESIAILRGLIELRPDEVRYRVMLLASCYHADEGQALAQILADAIAHFRAIERWDEPVIAALAAGCLEAHGNQDCVALYDQAIALRTRSAPGRGVGDGVLAEYYRNQASAYARLGMTDKAVDAASGAIVSRGRSQAERAEDLARLQEVLERAQDLDEYVARLDAQTETTGLENPVLRKALGKVYLRAQHFDRAERELRRASAYATGDREIFELLLTCYDAMGRRDLAASWLREYIDSVPHEVSLYLDLGRRYAELEERALAERALTNLVEAFPHESEGHQALAEVRQGQGQWEAAAVAWRHVIRIRTEEPTGYFGLVENLIRLERWSEARSVLSSLIARPWPEHFGDVRARAESLLRRLPDRG